MNDGLTHTLRLSRQEFSWVLGALRHTSMTLRNCNVDTDGLGERDVFTDGGVLGPASSKGIADLADALNNGQRDVPQIAPIDDLVGPSGEGLPSSANVKAFNAKLFEQVLDEIVAYPSIWNQDLARSFRPHCFICIVASKVKLRTFYASATASALLNLGEDAVEYLYQYHRTLADFKAFLACDGVPPLNWREHDAKRSKEDQHDDR